MYNIFFVYILHYFDFAVSKCDIYTIFHHEKPTKTIKAAQFVQPYIGFQR